MWFSKKLNCWDEEIGDKLVYHNEDGSIVRIIYVEDDDPVKSIYYNKDGSISKTEYYEGGKVVRCEGDCD
jgi:hypothetical protein